MKVAFLSPEVRESKCSSTPGSAKTFSSPSHVGSFECVTVTHNSFIFLILIISSNIYLRKEKIKNICLTNTLPDLLFCYAK